MASCQSEAEEGTEAAGDRGESLGEDRSSNASRGESDPCHQEALMRMIETQIIPRLMLSHRSPAASLPASRPPPSTDEVGELARLVIAHPASTARAYVDAMRGQGLSLDSIFVDLLGPAARMLGELWMEDLCSFADVTVGLSRLHQLVHDLSPSFVGGKRTGPNLGTVILAPAPGEQHTFGMLIASEFFRRAGWAVRAVTSVHSADLVDLVSNEWVQMVGFSVSNPKLADALRVLIHTLRNVSKNPDLIVMIGGASAEELRTRSRELGEVVCMANAQEAVDFLEQHLEQRPKEVGR
jgi:methanogenic corrinoid protein MtbC1